MIDWLADAGLQITMVVVGFGLLGAAVAATLAVQNMTGKKWAGGLAGLCAFVALSFVFGPTIGALQEAYCKKADDYAECMDD